jgi:hypothetical protein
MGMKLWILFAAIVLGLSGLAAADDRKLSADLVDRDLRVGAVVGGKEAIGTFTVIGNLREGPLRVPIIVGGEVKFVLEVQAELYERNGVTLLKNLVQIRLLDPTKTVTKGEAGTEPLALLECSRTINWVDPQELVVLQSSELTLTLKIKALREEAAGGEVGESAAD